MINIQILAIIGSLVLMVFIFALIRSKKLKEEYSLLWLSFSLLLFVFSLWKNGLEWIAELIGIAYAPAALFLILIMAIFIIMIEFSIIISKQSEWIKKTAQDIGILKLELDQLKEKNNEELEEKSNPK